MKKFIIKQDNTTANNGWNGLRYGMLIPMFFFDSICYFLLFLLFKCKKDHCK